MHEFWKAAVGAAGLGTVACFVFWSLYKDWLHLPALAKLTKRQIFKLFCLFLVLTFLFSLSGLAAYLATKKIEADSGKRATDELTGLLRDRYSFTLSTIAAKRKELEAQHQIALAFLATHQKSLGTSSWMPAPYAEAEFKLTQLETIEKRFVDLTARMLDALSQHQVTRAHEIGKQIQELLNSRVTGEFFGKETQLVLAKGGCGADDLYRPSFELADTFFARLPNSLATNTTTTAELLALFTRAPAARSQAKPMSR